jgi:hypothetical protein
VTPRRLGGHLRRRRRPRAQPHRHRRPCREPAALRCPARQHRGGALCPSVLTARGGGRRYRARRIRHPDGRLAPRPAHRHHPDAGGVLYRTKITGDLAGLERDRPPVWLLRPRPDPYSYHFLRRRAAPRGGLQESRGSGRRDLRPRPSAGAAIAKDPAACPRLEPCRTVPRYRGADPDRAARRRRTRREVREHGQPRGGQFPHDAPDPGGIQVMHRTRTVSVPCGQVYSCSAVRHRHAEPRCRDLVR